VRTTLTLDDDVAARLKEEARKSGRSFKHVVNEFLRLGFVAREKLRPEKDFVIRARDLGEKPGLNYDDVWGLIAQLDDMERK